MRGSISLFALPAAMTLSCASSAPGPAVAPESPPQAVTVESGPSEVADGVEGPAPLVVASGDVYVPSQADVEGKYADLVKVVHAPEDRESYGEFDDYGWWGPGTWAGEMQPAGYWVYVYPNWYIWRTSHALVKRAE